MASSELVEITRTQMKRDGRAMARAAGDELLAEISGEDWRRWWIAAFQVRLQRGERDAVQLYPELLQIVGAKDVLADIAERALGVASMAQAQSLINLARSVDGIDEQSLVESAIAGLRERGYTVLAPHNNATDGNGASPKG